jgi:hypothetical protein
VVFEGALSLNARDADEEKVRLIYLKLRAMKAQVFFCGHPRKCGFAKMYPHTANLKDEYVRLRPITGLRDTLAHPLVDPTGREWAAYLDKREQGNLEIARAEVNKPTGLAPGWVIDSTTRASTSAP